jgi:hypothetical protein
LLSPLLPNPNYGEFSMSDLIFKESLKIICWFPQGELTTTRIIEYYQRMKGCLWGYQANRYCDFSDITNFVLDYDKMQTLATYRQTNPKAHVQLKIGIYCSSDVGYAFSRMYQMLLDGYGVESFISRNLNEVAGFLQISESELRRDSIKGYC